MRRHDGRYRHGVESAAELGPDRRRTVGRPPKINREMIAEAANSVGLGDLTVRAVAEELDVSVATLYHHIDSKADLLRLAAERAASLMRVPEDNGQHWARWLLEWGRYNHVAFLTEPELLTQYLGGAISAEVIAENTDTIIGNLVRQGFTPQEAMESYHLITSCAIGAAVSAHRERELVASGRPTVEEHRRVLASLDDEELPHLRALVSRPDVRPRLSFDEEIATVLAGIAVRRGDRWRSIVDQLGDDLHDG